MAKRSQAPKPPKAGKNVEVLRHTDDKRLNIPTAEHQSVLEAEHVARKEIRYPRNTDLDPQFVWRGKDYQDWSALVVQAPPLYIQEKVHPKVLIDDLLRESKDTKAEDSGSQIDLFADFNGVAEGADRTDFYQHDQNWTNRMILGDSLQVMASLAEREGLRGKVQCIYVDPPYGIKFNSNFQWSTTTRDVRDGNSGHITREAEQVKAFRDTWRDGVHSYLTYLRDRLTVARDLLTESGSIFVQIGDENVHRVRALLDEVFGDDNLVSFVTVQKAGSTFSQYLGGIADFVLWYAKDLERVKYRPLYGNRNVSSEESGRFTIAQTDVGVRMPVSELSRMPALAELVAPDPLQSASAGRDKGEGAASWFPVSVDGRTFRPTMQSRWKTNETGMKRLIHADRIIPQSNSIRYARHFKDFSVAVLSNIWNDLAGATDKVYVVQTSTRIVERCVLMATDPGDLVLDPTCGSGTTATVAEQWGCAMTSGQFVQKKLQTWATRKGISLQGSAGVRGEPNYTHSIEQNLFDQILLPAVRASFDRGAGGELRGDIPAMSALHSSAAMAVNLFQYWVRNGDLAALARLLKIPSLDIASANFEDCFPVCEDPRRHGFKEPPHLDFAFRFQDGSRVGIECKLFEPYGRLDHAPLRRPYLNLTDAWSDIPTCRALAEQLATGSAGFHRLGASQLLKHILGLKFGAATAKVRLLYLYCDAIGDEAAAHREEIRRFKKHIEGDPVRFVPMSMQEFILRAVTRARGNHSAYVDYLSERYL